ncbi:MAG: hypothetical protein IJB74_03470 [Clostridia bacterium]|nr:hypothetical protein [Clostridia bacterium]
MNSYVRTMLQGYKSESIQSFLYNKIVVLFPFALYYFVVYREHIEGLQSLLWWSLVIGVCIEMFAVFTMYDIPIKAKYDLKFNKIINKRIVIKSVKSEYSWAGNNGDSRIGKFFPKSLSVDRYRIYYDCDGKKGYIRVLLSLNNMMTLNGLIELAKEQDRSTDLTFEVKFLQHSKVLYSISPSNGNRNKKQQQEQQDLIDSIFNLS